MSTLLDMLLNRRSVRSYTGEEIPEEKMKLVLQAGLLSESVIKSDRGNLW